MDKLCRLFTLLSILSSQLVYAAAECSAYTFEKMDTAPLSEDLKEMSGLVLSDLHVGALIHIRDSGNDPLLVYSNRNGAILQTYRFAEQVTDPEELAKGACPWNKETCIFVFDTGDNFHWRGSRSIWAIEEKSLKSPSPRMQKAHFRFPDGERLDVEAGVVIGKTVYVFAKEKKHSRVFALDSKLWSHSEQVATLVADLPYTMVTGASATRDGKKILLLNWQGAFELAESGLGPKVASPWYPYRRKIKLKGMEQQEAITYDEDQRSFLYTSEKKTFTKNNWGIMRASCP